MSSASSTFHLPPLPAMFHCSCFGLVDPSSFPSSFFIARCSGSCAEVASGIPAKTEATRRNYIAHPAIRYQSPGCEAADRWLMLLTFGKMPPLSAAQISISCSRDAIIL